MTNKEFVKQHIPFSTLKKVGFFPKEIKYNDYDGIVKRVLKWYGFESISDYLAIIPDMHSETEGSIPSTVSKSGELKSGCTFHLSKLN